MNLADVVLVCPECESKYPLLSGYAVCLQCFGEKKVIRLVDERVMLCRGYRLVQEPKTTLKKFATMTERS